MCTSIFMTASLKPTCSPVSPNSSKTVPTLSCSQPLGHTFRELHGSLPFTLTYVLIQPVISTSIGLQVPLLHPGAEQAEMPTIRSISARNRTKPPDRERGGAILMAPEGRTDAFIKKLKG